MTTLAVTKSKISLRIRKRYSAFTNIQNTMHFVHSHLPCYSFFLHSQNSILLPNIQLWLSLLNCFHHWAKLLLRFQSPAKRQILPWDASASQRREYHSGSSVRCWETVGSEAEIDNMLQRTLWPSPLFCKVNGGCFLHRLLRHWNLLHCEYPPLVRHWKI